MNDSAGETQSPTEKQSQELERILGERAAKLFSNLSHAENCLLRAAATGILQETFREDEGAVDEVNSEHPESFEPSMHIRAELLRWLLTEELPALKVPHRRITFGPALIDGPLTLERSNIDHSLTFMYSHFVDEIDLAGASVGDLGFAGCDIGKLVLSFAKINGSLLLTQETVHRKPLLLPSAEISARLLIDQARFLPDSGLSGPRCDHQR